jgi:hypothetical protein
MADPSFLNKLTPDEITYLAATFAVSISKGLDEPSLYVLNTFFLSVGSMLGLIGRQHDLLAGLYTNPTAATYSPPTNPPTGPDTNHTACSNPNPNVNRPSG